MCVVSMVSDHYIDKWKLNEPKSYQPITPNVIPPFPQQPVDLSAFIKPPVTRTEFDELKKEVLEMKELLKRAIKYDEKNNEPHCELDEKVAVLRKVAELVGVSLDDVFKSTDKK